MSDRILALAFVSSFLVTPLAAQQIWNAPQGTDLQAIVDGAAPGDILQLGIGNHSKFTLDKPMTIVGPAILGFTFDPMDLVIAMGPNDVARFVDVTITTDLMLPGFTAFGNVKVQSGTVVFEGCTIDGVDATGGSVDVQGANVVFKHTTVTGFSPGDAVTAHDANIVAIETNLVGATAGLVQPSSRGLTTTGNGSLHMSSCTVLGGDSTAALIPLDPSMAIVTDVDTWIVDSTISGGDGHLSDGADGMQAVNALVARSQITGGTGTVPGVPWTGSVVDDPNMLGASSSEVFQLGLPAYAQWTAAGPGVSIATLLSPNAPNPPIRFEPLVAQPLWALEMSFVAAINTDVSGVATLNLTVPNVTTLRYQSFALFGLAVDGARVQVAPIIAMTVR